MKQEPEDIILAARESFPESVRASSTTYGVIRTRTPVKGNRKGLDTIKSILCLAVRERETPIWIMSPCKVLLRLLLRAANLETCFRHIIYSLVPDWMMNQGSYNTRTRKWDSELINRWPAGDISKHVYFCVKFLKFMHLRGSRHVLENAHCEKTMYDFQNFGGTQFHFAMKGCRFWWCSLRGRFWEHWVPFRPV